MVGQSRRLASSVRRADSVPVPGAGHQKTRPKSGATTRQLAHTVLRLPDRRLDHQLAAEIGRLSNEELIPKALVS